MKQQSLKQVLSRVYLSLVPILTIVFGLGVGYISYKIYLPVWLLNVVLMGLAVYALGGNAIRAGDRSKKMLFAVVVCFIFPTLLTSMFFGLGAPPYESPALWVQTITEQRVRYYFLLAAGVSIATGFALLAQQLRKAGEEFYAVIGAAAMQMAAPVFLTDMSFWGFYLTRLYQQLVNAHQEKVPEWVMPLRTQFYYVNVLAAALIYLATAAFALSLKKTGWLKTGAANIYTIISLLFFVLAVLPPSLPEPFATLNFIVTIPALPFMFPYFVGISLLNPTGNDTRC